MSTSMEKIRQLVDVNTIVGEAITAPDGTTIIPISKVSFGFVSGGSDIPASKQIFAGGAGAGVTIKPMTFLVIKNDGDVAVLDAVPRENNFMENVLEAAPEFIEKIKSVFASMKGKELSDSETENQPKK